MLVLKYIFEIFILYILCIQIAPPEIARAHEYLRVILVWFQELKNIRLYRTPRGLRAYTKFFLAVFPVLFGPTFSFVANESGI